MNVFDDLTINDRGFSFGDLLGRDKWKTEWTPSFGSLTLVGTLTATGRYRFVGRKCEFQVSFSASTSIASVAGTDYLTLPVTAKGLSGFGVMTNDTTNISVGLCHLDVSTSQLFLPTQNASGNTFTLYGEYEY